MPKETDIPFQRRLEKAREVFNDPELYTQRELATYCFNLFQWLLAMKTRTVLIKWINHIAKSQNHYHQIMAFRKSMKQEGL